jgi:hypothetical protein
MDFAPLYYNFAVSEYHVELKKSNILLQNFNVEATPYKLATVYFIVLPVKSKLELHEYKIEQLQSNGEVSRCNVVVDKCNLKVNYCSVVLKRFKQEVKELNIKKKNRKLFTLKRPFVTLGYIACGSFLSAVVA